MSDEKASVNVNIATGDAAPPAAAKPAPRIPDQHRRTEDRGVLRDSLSRFWHWVDHRNIDLHAVLIVSLWLTIRVVEWSMDFADAHPELDGDKMYKIIGSVLGPWVLLQGAMFKFYAEARSKITQESAR
jgi:hypothetical protein